MQSLNNLPTTIGIFDSGIGGVSVLNALVYYPHVTQIFYFADTAYMPYGNKSYEILLERGCFITEFFLSKGITTIVVACHTASAVILHQLRHLYPHVHYIDLLFLTVAHAVHITKNKKIGVLATVNTIASGIHTRMIHALEPACQVITQASPDLVPLLESVHIDINQLQDALSVYLYNAVDASVDTLILGCTHYPFLYNYCSDLFMPFKFLVSAYHVLMPENIVIDSISIKKLAINFYVTGFVHLFESKISIFANQKVLQADLVYHTL